MKEREEILYHIEDLKQGHSYKDLHGRVFCYVPTGGKDVLEYFDSKSPSSIDISESNGIINPLLQGVSEIDPEKYLRELEDELERVKSRIEQLVKN